MTSFIYEHTLPILHFVNIDVYINQFRLPTHPVIETDFINSCKIIMTMIFYYIMFNVCMNSLQYIIIICKNVC